MEEVMYDENGPYCGECMEPPEGTFASVGDNECDSPQHCQICRRPVPYSLTSDGVNYVVEKLKESLQDRDGLRSEICWDLPPGDYYLGSKGWAVLRDWALELHGYGLEPDQKEIVNQYLDLIGE